MRYCATCNIAEYVHTSRHPFVPKETDWSKRFMDLAEFYAQWSKDPSTKVGAVITDDIGIVKGMGYNGFPRGVDDSPERYADKAEKYPRVVHAELNAILNANGTVRGSSIYTTLPPCASCACAIIQAGIRRVVVNTEFGDDDVSAHWKRQWEISMEMFRESGVEIEYV